jgi:hypothetical protein
MAEKNKKSIPSMRPISLKKFYETGELRSERAIAAKPHVKASLIVEKLSHSYYDDAETYDPVKGKQEIDKYKKCKKRKGRMRRRRRTLFGIVKTVKIQPPKQLHFSPWMRKEISSLISVEGKKKLKPFFIYDDEGVDMVVMDPNAVVLNLDTLGPIYDDFDKPNVDTIYRGREHRRSPVDSLLAAKVASSKCKGIGLDFLREKLSVFERSFKVKTNILRGDKRTAITKVYVCYGYRKDPDSKGIAEYTFNHCTKEEAEQMNESVRSLVSQIEKRASSILECLADTSLYDFMTCCLNVPTFTNQRLCTQFSIGKDYWSAMHVDDDYFFTTLACFSPDPEKHKDAILYHFVFPEYGLAIPMRHGDILIFNPTVMHCCTNPRIEGSYICSAYVSKKTILTHVSFTH